MSIEAVWDLQVTASPRCLVAYPLRTTAAAAAGFGPPPLPPNTTTTTSSSNNPFDVPFTSYNSVSTSVVVSSTTSSSSSSSSNQTSILTAVLYGTDRGTWHYRTYAPPAAAAFPTSTTVTSITTSSSSVLPAQLPLGTSTTNNNNTNHSSMSSSSSPPPARNPTIPMGPIDWHMSLPGPIVASVPLFDPARIISSSSSSSTTSGYRGGGTNHNHNSSSSSRKQPPAAAPVTTPSFLLLVDDARTDDPSTPTTTTSSTHPNNNNSSSSGSRSSSTTKTFATVIVVLTSSSSSHIPSTSFTNHGRYGFQIMAASFSTASTASSLWGLSSASSSASSSSLLLPRMSCAVFVPNPDHPPGQLWYGTGRTIQTVATELWDVATKFPSSKGRPFVVDPANPSPPPLPAATRPIVVLPHPGLRSGPDAMLVVGQYVVIVAVANTFYGVMGRTTNMDAATNIHSSSANHHDVVPTNAAALLSKSDEVVKILSFQQSSQVYPVMILNLDDLSFTEKDWYSIFFACGRECAVVDVHLTKTQDSTSSSPSSMTNDTLNDAMTTTFITCSTPRNGIVTVTSPILSAASSWPYVVLLQTDGLVSIRSSSCLAVSLRTIEVGQRPNDYFTLRSVPSPPLLPSHKKYTTTATTPNHPNNYVPESLDLPSIVAMAYSGECKVLRCQPDTLQDFADRMMRHAIDAFGTNGFPRVELAEALQVSFAATSYTNPITTTNGGEAPTLQSRNVFKQYLEAVLGLTDFDGGSSSGWPMEFVTPPDGGVNHGAGIGLAGRGPLMPAAGSAGFSAAAILCATALLCLACSHVSPPNASLANRAAKTCSERIGTVLEEEVLLNKATIQVCELIAEKLLREASSKFSLSSSASPTPIARVNRNTQSTNITLFFEASIWLLRSCGKHERAIEVSFERLQQQGQQQMQQSDTTDGGGGATVRGFWSQIKYESYTATHLSELWSTGKEMGCQLVLSSPAAHRLLERNPRLGLSVFTAMHPQNEVQWRSMSMHDDPLSNPSRIHQVLQLLKSISPLISTDKERTSSNDSNIVLPLESGRALAVSFLRSAIGVSTGRSVDAIDTYDHYPVDSEFEQHVSNIHDELALLLLEGVIVERSDNQVEASTPTSNTPEDNELGSIYRMMLRELLQWPMTKIRPSLFMEALPPTFLQEKALVLGRLGQHEDALRILYGELNSLDLALAYCDHRYNRQKVQYERTRMRQQKQQYQNMSMYSDLDQSDDFEMKGDDNAYIPLIRVALDSKNTERGTATAIKVLALRRGAVDRAAALRLLPSDVPVSAVARPFLIPALVESESQVRRMTVVSALLKSRYLRLKDKLTTAQLKAQANIHVVPALRSLNLGEPLHSTKSTRVRTTNVTPSSTMPYVEIVKYFFQRHLVIQAKVTNVPYSSYPSTSSVQPFGDKPGSLSNALATSTSTLCDITFVVAESSDEEAITPLLQVPIQVLPYKMTGSAWCVLSAIPSNMDAPTAQLTCELRYSVQQSNVVNNSNNANSYLDNTNNFTYNNSAMMIASTRTFVEELQDLEIHATHFLPKAVQ